MKKKLVSVLCAALLLLPAGCGSSLPPAENPEVSAPPAETAEEITYEVTTDLYEKDILADDGTLLMHISFALPQLQAYADGTLIETPTSPEQQRARQNTETFNTLFAQWKNSESTNETTDELQREYREFPDNFTGEYAISYEEDLTYDVYRTGTLISLSATYYSYLGGAHPNMVYFSWNFDLESGSFLSIPELAQDPQAFTLAVADGIEAQAADRFKAEVSDLSDIYWDNYREVMEKWGSDYAAFFTADGMTVIFSAYELTSYAAGPQEFHFSYADLDGYWSDSGRSVLGLD